MVVLRRPNRDSPEATFHERGSYKQWEEDNIAPQVVFEILSPSNSAREMLAKQAFYGKYGVLEMFFYDPDSYDFLGLIRSAPNEDLTPIMQMDFPWTSPMLGIRFEMFEDGLAIFHPNGERFKDPIEFIDEHDSPAETLCESAFAKLRELGFDPINL